MRYRQLFIRSAIWSSIFIAYGSLALWAQVPDPVLSASAPVPGSGHHYLGSLVERVNPADGSVTLDLPIQLPRGRQLNLPFGFHYNSQYSEYPARESSDNVYQLYWQDFTTVNDGWGNDLPMLTFAASEQNVYVKPCPNATNPITCWETVQTDVGTNYVFKGLDGVSHTLQIAIEGYDYDTYYDGYNDYQVPNTLNTPGSGEGILAAFGSGPNQQDYFDGSPPVTVTDQSGDVFEFPDMGRGIGHITQFPGTPYNWWSNPTQIMDRNGNTIRLNSTGNGYTDSLGHTVLTWSNSGSETSYYVEGLGYINEYWTTINVTFPESYQNINTGTCNIAGNQSYPETVVSKITLPNGQQWLFNYNDVYGRISRITYPDGGYVHYDWGLNSKAYSQFYPSVSVPLVDSNTGQTTGTTTTEPCTLLIDAPVVKDRYVYYNANSGSALHQHFSYSTDWDSSNTNGTWNSKQTIVTSTDNITGQSWTTTYNYSS